MSHHHYKRVILVLFIGMMGCDGRSEKDVYVSKSKGHDTPSCGSQSTPCQSISMGVWNAEYDGRVYIDGTGTQTSPYTCESLSSKLQDIYVNKSLTIIGVQPPVNVKCREGLGIRLNCSHAELNGTRISLIDIDFNGSPLDAEDVDVYIDNCVFIGGLYAISLTQSTRSVYMSFTNSVCLNTSSCIIAEIRKQHRLEINMTHSNVLGSLQRAMVKVDHAIGLHVTATGNPVYTVLCDISLNNVTFANNVAGSKGIIYLDLKNAMSSLHLVQVEFFDNTFTARSNTMVSILGSYKHTMLLSNTKITTNNQARAISVDVRNSTTLSIRHCQFTEASETSSKAKGGVLYLYSDNDIELYIRNSSCSNNRSPGYGGCVYLKGRTAVVDIKDSHFSTNRGADCGGVLYLSGVELLVATIVGSHFESNGFGGPGGLAVLHGRVVNVTMLDSKVNGSKPNGPGGVFDIGATVCGGEQSILAVDILLRNVSVEQSSSDGLGGFAGITAQSGSIIIQDCAFYKVYSFGPGAVIFTNRPITSSNFSSRMPGFSIDISNSVFKETYSNASGGVLAVYSVYRLLLNGVTIDSTTAAGPGGAIFLQTELDFECSINNSTFKNCSSLAASGGGFCLVTMSSRVFFSVSNSLFQSMTSRGGPGGCMFLFFKQSTQFALTNVSFHNCRTFSSMGGAVYVMFSKGSSNIHCDYCSFVNNTASAATAGAISILFPKDEILDPGCVDPNSETSTIQSIPHRTWSYHNRAEFINTVFINNTAQRGGAVAVLNGQHSFTGCTFVDNFAAIRGGHIMVDSDSTSVIITNTTFVQTQANTYTIIGEYKMHFPVTTFIDSQSEGPLTLIDSTLTSIPLGDVKPMLLISKGGVINFGTSNSTTLKCPRGSELEILNFTFKVNTENTSKDCYNILQFLQFNCKSCGLGTYSLQHGRSVGARMVDDFQCLSCPFGAVCFTNIEAKANFWGYPVVEDHWALNFTICPVGYCRHPDTTVNSQMDYNSCHGNRTGILCGQCRVDYTETLLSPACRRADHCKDTWLWGVAVLIMLLIATYLVYKPRMSRFLRCQMVWFRKDTRRFQEGIDQERIDQEADTKSHSGGYLKIVFYFYQVANLLLVSTSYDTVVEQYLVQPVIGFFNFQFSFSASSAGFVCPFPGLTVVTKSLLFTSQVIGVLVMICLCYFSHCLLHKIKSRPSPNLGPYLGATLETLLLGYAVFANAAFKLLRCTSIGGESRLFIAGHVLCYQWWQYLLMVFVCVVVVPFVVLLALGAYWLYKETISVRQFLLGCVFPLPYLVFRLVSFICGRPQRNTEPAENQPRISGEPAENQPRTNREPAEWKTSVVCVLYGPFRSPSEGTSGALYWESVLTGRRLVIIIIYAFLTDPFCKQLLLTFACVVILLHHSMARPFRTVMENTVETASLLSLVAIAIINTFKAGFLSMGEAPGGPLKTYAEVFDWVQIVILSVVPTICILVILMTVVSQFIRLVVYICLLVYSLICSHVSGERQVLLDSSQFSDSQ